MINIKRIRTDLTVSLKLTAEELALVVMAIGEIRGNASGSLYRDILRAFPTGYPSTSYPTVEHDGCALVITDDAVKELADKLE